MPELPDIQVIRSNRRSIALQIKPDATLLVKAPQKISQRQIDTFITEHKDWIDKHIALVKKRMQPSRKEGEYPYLGMAVALTPGNYTQIAVQEDKLLFPQGLLFRKDKELTNWYIKQAEEIISRQLEKYAREMKTSYTSVMLSDTRSKWGSCTHDNRLQFSWRLVMAPLLVLNYVVIHELAHTMEKNHTQMFWMKVRSVNPSYRQQIKWLKEHGSTLTIT